MTQQMKNSTPKLPPPVVIHLVERLRNALESLRKKSAPPSVVMIEMVTSFFVPQALYVAATLGIADLLKDGPHSVTELAQATGTDAQALYRLLRGLASVGVFRETRNGHFQLTPLAATLRTDVPTSMRAMVLMNGSPFHWRPWGELLYSVKTGQPAFRHLFHMTQFEYLAQHAEAGEVFNRAMTNFSALAAAAVEAAYDFSPIRTLVDVGGGNGLLISTILKAHPTMRGILFDVPQVVAAAPELLEAQGIAERCEIVGGDFFEAVPGGGDAYLLKNVIHDWGDDQATAILKQCHAAMPENGRLLLVEMVIQPGNAPSFGKLLDLDMLIFTTGGCERTEAEFRKVLAASGFRLTRVVATASPMHVLEAVRISTGANP